MSALAYPWLESTWAQLVRAHQEQRLGHGLLVGGVAGLGQEVLCARLAALLLCEKPGAEAACGSCRGCQWVQADAHPDLQRVTLIARDDGKLKQEIAVDQIRELSRWFALSPHRGGAQVALIDPADRMGAAAANALLKTLEEPAPDRFLILRADQPERLPQTVRSRCQRVLVRLPDADTALQWLAARGHPADQAGEALAVADGHPVEADRLLAEQGMQRLRGVRADLRAMLERKATAQSVARRWLGGDGDQAIRDAVRVVRSLGWDAARGGARLTAPEEFHKLAAWSVRADAARRHLAVPLRHELMLTDLLSAWTEAAGSVRWFDQAASPERGKA